MSANEMLTSWMASHSNREAMPDGWDSAAPTLMCATDDGYVQPLAASLVSCQKHYNGNGQPLQLILLDGGISEEQWERFSRLLTGLQIRCIRLVADRTAVAGLAVSHHISHTAYLRLLSSQWLPDWIEQVIYLDCDTIVLDDLNELWNLAQKGSFEVWAVPDIACPFIDATRGCDDYNRFGPYLAAKTPVANYRDLGFDGTEWYFNSGVMILDLVAWRSAGRSHQLLECLRDNQRFVWCWDQYALNVVFRERWGRLPLRWNFGSHTYDYPRGPSGEHEGPILPEQFSEMQLRPAVVHFTTEIKPWDYFCFHPLKDLYWEYLDQTPWEGQRPEYPGVGRWWHVQTFKFQKRLLATSRRLGW